VIQNESSIHIARPIDDVFAFVDDFSKAPSWLESCVELKQVSPGVKGAGTRLHYAYRQGGHVGEMDGTVTAYEKNGRLELKYADGTFEVEVRFRFASEPGGTAVTHSVAITPKRFFARLMSPMIRKMNGKQVANNLSRLKQLLESA
jgi:uncharacterized membrane protein